MVKPKKHLGQHFLRDHGIAAKIAASLQDNGSFRRLVEIGPGTGVLTRFLLDLPYELHLVEVDKESVDYLAKTNPFRDLSVHHQDFLGMELPFYREEAWAVIGNFPYNISSQIFFRILEYKSHVMQVVCMLQKEVAQRLVSGPGNKQYGILSVFLQAYFSMEYLFEVPPEAFRPPPKVDSAVIRLKRNQTDQLDCDELLFRKIVKQGFQNRRKTLRNALKPLNLGGIENNFDKIQCRAEELNVQDFVRLTQIAEEHGTHH